MDNNSLISRINEGLAEIRPYLESDGGNVSLVKITSDFTVFVRLEGACKSCDVNQMTLKLGVEEAIKKYAPEINAVETID